MSGHDSRTLALEFGATRILAERGAACVAAVKDRTDRLGAQSVFEAAGTPEAMMQAIHGTRPGGNVGFAGVTHDVALHGMQRLTPGLFPSVVVLTAIAALTNDRPGPVDPDDVLRRRGNRSADRRAYPMPSRVPAIDLHRRTLLSLGSRSVATA